MKLVALAIVLMSTPALAECSFAHGGLIYDCAEMVDNLGPHQVLPLDYRSAGTFILRNATCISSGSKFSFHAAVFEGGIISYEGNDFQRSQLRQYPGLLSYLNKVGAFRSLRFTTLSAQMVSRLTRLPICAGWFD